MISSQLPPSKNQLRNFHHCLTVNLLFPPLPLLYIGDDITVKHCSHALALFYVAAEEAASKATKGNEKGLVSPGTLRMNLIDALHNLDEPHVRLKAQIFAHSTGTKSS